MNKQHYEILGFYNDPSKSDDQADHKLQATNKKQVLGAVIIFLDNFGCDHIAIFKTEDVKNESNWIEKKKAD